MQVRRLSARTELPQDGAGLDPANPLAQRFQAAYLPAISGQNLGFGGPGALPSHGLSRVAIPAGPATFHDSVDGQVAADRSFGPTPVYPLTLVLVCRQVNTANSVLAGVTASGGVGGSYYYLSGGSSTQVGLSARNSFGTPLNLLANVPGGTSFGTDLVIVSQSFSASSHMLCVNGSAVAVSLTNIGAMVAWDRMFFGTASGNLSVACALFGHGTVWTEDEMRQLSSDVRNVWRLFARRRFGLPVFAAPSGIRVLSNLQATAITGTTARLRMTFTVPT